MLRSGEGVGQTRRWGVTDAAAAHLTQHGTGMQQQKLVLQYLSAEQLDKSRHGTFCDNFAAGLDVPARE